MGGVGCCSGRPNHMFAEYSHPGRNIEHQALGP